MHTHIPSINSALAAIVWISSMIVFPTLLLKALHNDGGKPKVFHDNGSKLKALHNDEGRRQALTMTRH
jgi:hypothetical protein